MNTSPCQVISQSFFLVFRLKINLLGSMLSHTSSQTGVSYGGLQLHGGAQNDHLVGNVKILFMPPHKILQTEDTGSIFSEQPRRLENVNVILISRSLLVESQEQHSSDGDNYFSLATRLQMVKPCSLHTAAVVDRFQHPFLNTTDVDIYRSIMTLLCTGVTNRPRPLHI